MSRSEEGAETPVGVRNLRALFEGGAAQDAETESINQHPKKKPLVKPKPAAAARTTATPPTPRETPPDDTLPRQAAGTLSASDPSQTKQSKELCETDRPPQPMDPRTGAFPGGDTAARPPSPPMVLDPVPAGAPHEELHSVHVPRGTFPGTGEEPPLSTCTGSVSARAKPKPPVRPKPKSTSSDASIHDTPAAVLNEDTCVTSTSPFPESDAAPTPEAKSHPPPIAPRPRAPPSASNKPPIPARPTAPLREASPTSAASPATPSAMDVDAGVLHDAAALPRRRAAPLRPDAPQRYVACFAAIADAALAPPRARPASVRSVWARTKLPDTELADVWQAVAGTDPACPGLTQAQFVSAMGMLDAKLRVAQRPAAQRGAAPPQLPQRP